MKSGRGSFFQNKTMFFNYVVIEIGVILSFSCVEPLADDSHDLVLLHIVSSAIVMGTDATLDSQIE